MVEEIDHVNLVVRDLQRMMVFYRDVLGFRVTKNVTISGEWVDNVAGLQGVEADVIYLDPPKGPRIELIHYRHPASNDKKVPTAANALGLRHLAFRVSDIDATARCLANAGIMLNSSISTVPSSQVQYSDGAQKRLAYFRDPEGNLLEICEYH